MEIIKKVMNEKQTYKLKIEMEFKRLIPPLSMEEFQQLEANIIRDGCRDPLCIWNKKILDGHNRYEICMRAHIPFAIHQIRLANHEEAIAWICANQLGRRNITEETRKYLIGKRYETEKILGAHNAIGINQHSKKEVRANILPEAPFGITARRTREKLAEEYCVSHASVLQYGHYSRALDILATTVPELVEKILSGESRISQDNTIFLSRLPEKETDHLQRLVSADIDQFDGHVDIKRLFPTVREPDTKPVFEIPRKSIKDMPSYDPDAEISSLTLTVPSWVSSICRTRKTTDLNKITNNARRKLERELVNLKEIIESLLAALKEEMQ